MALLSLKNVGVSFGGPPLLEEVNLQIERGERVCLLGRNGSGKTTLLAMIHGDLLPDEGEIRRQPGLRVALLPQEVPQGVAGRVREVVAGGPDAAPADAAARQRTRQQIETAVSRMKLDPDAEFGDLSAGYRRRALLARALARQPDLLLLDEPTNHLDIDSIRWLEEFFCRYDEALLFVTHDRVFLQKLATRIIEIDRGRLTSWACDYNTFLARKAAALEEEARHWAEFDRKLAKEEAWIRQGIKARRTRNEGRVRELMKMREVRRARRERTGAVRLQAQEAERSGELVVSVEGVSFSYGDRPIVRALSTTIMRGDKVGILGPNGCGKTTLLRVLLGELPPQQGKVRLGARLQTAYFDQLRAQLDESKSVLENVGNGYDTLTINGRQRHALGYLQDFLFTPDRARSPVWQLSGGERNRLLLARLFARPANVLVLDEPTNDLDAETLELLEELLLDYPGTALLVSHDRALLNNVVTSTLVFEGNGQVNEYVGGYDDWLRQRKPEPPPKAEKAPPSSQAARPQPDRPRPISPKERRELDRLPERIEALEAELRQLDEELALRGRYLGPTDLAKADAKREGLEEELRAAYQRWEALEKLLG